MPAPPTCCCKSTCLSYTLAGSLSGACPTNETETSTAEAHGFAAGNVPQVIVTSEPRGLRCPCFRTHTLNPKPLNPKAGPHPAFVAAGAELAPGLVAHLALPETAVSHGQVLERGRDFLICSRHGIHQQACTLPAPEKPAAHKAMDTIFKGQGLRVSPMQSVTQHSRLDLH